MRRARCISAALRYAQVFYWQARTPAHTSSASYRRSAAVRSQAQKMALLDAVLPIVPNTRNHAQTLSTICVDKVVHSLRKMNLSGPRKRLFCRCPKFELTFLYI
jgi:sulfate adenylyltransferase subunit 1 (EFTu-like GTPase family)